MILAVSTLARASRPLQERMYAHSRSHTFQNTGATIWRRLGKGLAIISAGGTLLVCFFQIAGTFNDRFRNFTSFDRGYGLAGWRSPLAGDPHVHHDPPVLSACA